MTVSIAQAQEFVVGFVGDLLKYNDLGSLENCVNVTQGIATDVVKILQYIENLDITSIVKGIEES